MTRFVDVYNPDTGIKQSVPEHFLDDPVLGRNLRKTPAQRALDGELGQAPTSESTIPEIKAFAADAEIDLAGLSRKDDLLAAVRAVVGTDPLPEPVPAGDVDVLPETDVEAPAGMRPIEGMDRNGDPLDADQNGVIDVVDTPTSTDDTESSDNSAAAAGQE